MPNGSRKPRDTIRGEHVLRTGGPMTLPDYIDSSPGDVRAADSNLPKEAVYGGSEAALEAAGILLWPTLEMTLPWHFPRRGIRLLRCSAGPAGR